MVLYHGNIRTPTLQWLGRLCTSAPHALLTLLSYIPALCPKQCSRSSRFFHHDASCIERGNCKNNQKQLTKIYFPKTDAGCPSDVTDNMQTIPSSATEALKQAACAAYDGMIKAFPTTGTGSIEKADIGLIAN